MSYILDALKKAADQRDVHAPAMQRLLSTAPDIEESPRWRMALTGGAAAVGGAAVVAMVWLLWPTTPVIVTDTADATPPTARFQPETPPVVQPPAPPAPPIVRTTPAPVAPAKTTAAKAAPEKRPAAVTPGVVETRRPSEDDAPARPQPTSPSVIAALRPGPPAVAAAAPAVTSTPTVSPPRAERSSPLKLEVIVYSDERARRLAFINGRKYVEGDTLLDGSKVQEIQQNAVVIVEDGRRVVLRP